jgi:protein-S-isoprenylcysteine O-methyltransferase Ste14
MATADAPQCDEPVRPPLRVPPPLVTLTILGVSLGIHFAFPQTIFPDGWVQFVVGIPAIVIGLALGLSTNVAFGKAGTDDRFAKPTSAIVQTGANARIRNPMYVGLVLIYLGIVLTVNAAWALLGLPVLVAYLHLGVIRREEEYLEDCFEAEYLAYKAKVPRWIPRPVTETS